jgi:hypothetical protein
MQQGDKLDQRLIWVMRCGTAEIPEDLEQLEDYLETIGALLAEKAAELEPTWEQACAAAAEIATLQQLELAVAERAIGLRAVSLPDVRAKLAIWRVLASTAGDAEPDAPCGRLALSIEADLERIARTR